MYPLTYFKNIWNANKIFKSRKSLCLWQQIMITIFLAALLTMPIVSQFLFLETYPMNHLFESVFEPVAQMDENILSKMHIENGQFESELSGQVSDGIFVNTESIASEAVAYQFNTTTLTITVKGSLLVEMPMSYFTSDDFKTSDVLVNAINDHWFKQEKLTMVNVLIISTLFIVGSNLFFLLVFSSGILYLTKKTKLFDFHSFKECYNFILYCAGLPTIIACFVGFLTSNIFMSMMVQNGLFVLVLIGVFFKTHFKNRTE